MGQDVFLTVEDVLCQKNCLTNLLTAENVYNHAEENTKLLMKKIMK